MVELTISLTKIFVSIIQDTSVLRGVAWKLELSTKVIIGLLLELGQREIRECVFLGFFGEEPNFKYAANGMKSSRRLGEKHC